MGKRVAVGIGTALIVTFIAWFVVAGAAALADWREERIRVEKEESEYPWGRTLGGYGAEMRTAVIDHEDRIRALEARIAELEAAR